MGTGIGLKLISELQGMSFFIPNYQRGYRWTEQQVKDLLTDINEFVPNEKNKFYCLQPVVVKKKDCEWEVIDGQQRLTTIFLILSWIEKGEMTEEYFDINYATREKSKEFLSSIRDDAEHARKLLDEYDNIDYYHIWQAYMYITQWFGDNEEKDTFRDKLLNNVQFIWYISAEEENPVAVFKRLNIGKISLTNAELIKALFLNRSHFSSESTQLRLRQQEIASEWDNIEYTLQDEEFWLFLHDKGYTNPTRIDFIFDLICENDKLGIKEKVIASGRDYDKVIGTDKYRTFRYFYEYFKLKEAALKSCWAKVKKYYNTFNEWYHDLKLYHYIGYLIECKQDIEELVKKWDEVSNKRDFADFLKEQIKARIDNCPHKDNQSVLDYQYDGSDKRQCMPILLFHNIQTVINQNTKQQANEKYQLGVFYKFPFHLYKMEGWDVEHINSNTTNREKDDKTREEWLCNVYLGVNDDIRKEIDKYPAEMDKNKKDDLWEKIKNAVDDDYKDWSQEEKNKICNYALLDSSTNRSYGNSIFSAKRRIVIGKDKGVLIPIPKIQKGKVEPGQEQEALSSFVPPCTKQVFLKYYSSAIGNSNYWLPMDAKAYRNDIENCIKQLEKPKKEQK